MEVKRVVFSFPPFYFLKVYIVCCVSVVLVLLFSSILTKVSSVIHICFLFFWVSNLAPVFLCGHGVLFSAILLWCPLSRVHSKFPVCVFVLCRFMFQKPHGIFFNVFSLFMIYFKLFYAGEGIVVWFYISSWTYFHSYYSIFESPLNKEKNCLVSKCRMDFWM